MEDITAKIESLLKQNRIHQNTINTIVTEMCVIDELIEEARLKCPDLKNHYRLMGECQICKFNPPF